MDIYFVFTPFPIFGIFIAFYFIFGIFISFYSIFGILGIFWVLATPEPCGPHSSGRSVLRE